LIIVLNATPLIYVTKIGFSWIFEKLRELGVKIIVPETVYQEVVTIGKEKEFSDAIIVNEWCLWFYYLIVDWQYL